MANSFSNISDPRLVCCCHALSSDENGTREQTEDEDKPECSNSAQLMFNENFNYTHTACYLCNGYFGPCFNEPLCGTCHAFVFPDNDPNAKPISIYNEKTDDGDSGNDEPTDPVPERWLNQNRAPVPQISVDDNPPQNPSLAPLSLSKRLEMLSIPRDENDTISPGLVEHLPPEVLLTLFSYLDDLSLWSCANVCKHWKQLLTSLVPDASWERYTFRRWPLFKPMYNVDNWFCIYSHLIRSCPCFTCIQDMSSQAPPGQGEHWRDYRLHSEIKILHTDPPEGIEAIPLDAKYFHWQGTITGPADSPYAGGLFYLYIRVPYNYPMRPPMVRFLTRIFHPNVSRHGDVGIDSIHYNWSLALTISKVLISIQSLLTDPFCKVCMEPEIGALYLKDKATFEDIAQKWTWQYAMHDVVKPEKDPSPL